MRFVPSRSQRSKARDGPERTWCDGSLVIVATLTLMTLKEFEHHRARPAGRLPSRKVIGEGNLARSEDPVCQVDDTAVWQLTFSFLVKDRQARHYLSARAGSSLSMYRPMNS